MNSIYLNESLCSVGLNELLIVEFVYLNVNFCNMNGK